ncbi:MAG TPA: pre-peptidase C-terminal domain-containing protein [Longimicrobium sp.]|nr:pre-peptidase C-terminal domain-containing protein [Longimicrobium sp.]
MKLAGQGWRVLALAAFVTACGGDGGTEAPVATGVSATSPTFQSALAGAAVASAPAVRVTDQDGDPMAGVTVTFVAAGGGAVATPSATTDAAGNASAGTWTLGATAGAQTVTATAGSLAPVQFSATAQARVATTVTAMTPTTQSGEAGTLATAAPTVRVNDQAGQPLAGATVTFTVAAGGGTVGSSTVVTGANGMASSNSWTLGGPGANTVTASVGGLTPVAFNATVQAPVPTSIVAVSATAQTGVPGAAVAQVPTVLVTRAGQPLAWVTVTFTVTAGNGTLGQTSVVTGAAGTASPGSWTLGAGMNTVTATVPSLPSVTFTATAQAPAAGSIVAVSPTTQAGTAGAPVAQVPTVRVNNAAGQPLAGVAVTFAVTAGGGTLGQTSVITGASGTASPGSWTLGAVGANTVTASVPGLPAVTFNATASPATNPCATAAVYTLFSNVAGSLTTADCRLQSGEYIDIYGTTLSTAQAVSFTMQSTTFDTWLELADGNGNIVAVNDDIAQTNSNSSISVFAPAGTYFIGASSFDAGVTGAYQLSSAGITGNNNCGQFWVVPGVVINGQVQATDCSFGGHYTDEYLVVLDAGETLTVQMRSTTMNSYLELYDLDGALVAQNDDGAGGQDAVITYTATELSIFFLDASTAQPGVTGSYALTVTRT